MEDTADDRFGALLSTLDALSPVRPRGLALRPGFPIYRASGEALGLTKPGDHVRRWDYVAGGPVRLPMPASHVQEWVAGEISDADGPWCTCGYVPAAAVNPHA